MPHATRDLLVGTTPLPSGSAAGVPSPPDARFARPGGLTQSQLYGVAQQLLRKAFGVPADPQSLQFRAGFQEVVEGADRLDPAVDQDHDLVCPAQRRVAV